MGNKNIKYKINTEVTDLLKDIINKDNDENLLKFYNGKIVDNNDPEMLGRCKIRVFGIFGEDIPDNDLPFAIPDFGFIGSTVGSFVVPPLDAIVKVYFENGDIYTPKYTTKVIDKNNLSIEREEDYPDTMVLFETDQGEYFKINRKTLETTYHTSTGTDIVFDGKGNVLINTIEAEEGNILFKTKNNTQNILLGEGAEYNLVRGNILKEILDQLHTDLTNWIPIPMDGGASLKAILMAGFVAKYLPYKATLEGAEVSYLTKETLIN